MLVPAAAQACPTGSSSSVGGRELILVCFPDFRSEVFIQALSAIDLFLPSEADIPHSYYFHNIAIYLNSSLAIFQRAAAP
jgi:hypothetical protein